MPRQMTNEATVKWEGGLLEGASLPKESRLEYTAKTWVAVEELKLRDYPPIMENQMEKKMENEMETGGIEGFKEPKLSYYIGETLLFTIYTHYGNLI